MHIHHQHFLKDSIRSLLGAFTVASGSLVPGLHAQTANPTVLYTFPASAQGPGTISPLGSLVPDDMGNFYGTDQGGGANGEGEIYKVAPDGTFTSLYSFTGNADGAYPVALTLGSDGTLYGVTNGGGSNNDGTIFKLAPDGTFTVLHTFDLTDGRNPTAGMVFGQDGLLYGTTAGGGANNTGTFFSITTDGATYTLLHSFLTGEGTGPQDPLLLGPDGNFYGTAAFNGTSDNRFDGNGSIFKLTPDGTLTVLHLFTGGDDGANPFSPLTRTTDGTLYGAAPSGGMIGTGTLFKLAEDGTGFTVLHNFANNPGNGPANADGGVVQTALIDGDDGKLYGFAGYGGPNGPGTVFSITPDGTFTLLYVFPATDSNGVNTIGATPFSSSVRGTDGRFYLPLLTGGANAQGTIVSFRVVDPPSSFFAGEVAISDGVNYLQFADGTPFGYYSYLDDPRYLYHNDLGYEYAFDAGDGMDGVYLYDFASGDFLYTSPTFPFPYLYDFTLGSVLYYEPKPANAGHYTSNPRQFYDFATGQVITR